MTLRDVMNVYIGDFDLYAITEVLGCFEEIKVGEVRKYSYNAIGGYKGYQSHCDVVVKVIVDIRISERNDRLLIIVRE